MNITAVAHTISIAGRAVICAIIVCTLCAGAAAAATDLRELVSQMNFEQAARAGQSLPRGWDQSPLTGPDIPETARFPHYLRGMVTNEFATEGGYSFMLSLNGGNLAYTYTDTVDASGDYDYLVTGMLRTDLLNVSRAQVRMQLMDIRGQAIEGALSVSKPLGAPGSRYYRKWSPFTLKLEGRFPDAYTLQVSLALVQPEIWRNPHELVLDRQDIRGLCWWDDLKVYRLPRVSLQTSSPTNTFRPSAPRILIASTEGLDTSRGWMALSVRDSKGSVIIRRIVSRSEQAGGRVMIELPKMLAGLYSAQLEISAGSNQTLTRKIEFAVLPSIPPGGQSGPIIDAMAMPPRQWSDLADLASDMQAAAVILSPWQPTGTNLEAAIDMFNAAGIGVTIAWDRMPGFAPLDQGARHGDLFRSLAEGDKWLQDDVQLMLSQHAASVNAWQLGACGDTALAWNQYLEQAYSFGSQWVRNLIADRDLLLSWDGSVAYDLPENAPLTIRIDNGIQPWLIPAQLSEFGTNAKRIYLPIDDHPLESPQLLDDFALRYTYARAAGIEGIVIPPVWSVNDKGAVIPDPLILTARTLAGWLGEARFIGSARLDDRRTAIMFRRLSGDGAMLIHAIRDSDPMPVLEMELPGDARVIDLRGRAIPLEFHGDKATLPNWTGAYLVTGCDADTLAIRASMKFTPDTVQSEYRNQKVTFSVDNPFPSPMVGEATFEVPPGWTIVPDSYRFSIEPGGSGTVPLTVRFPFAAITDLHRINTTVQVYRGREMRLSAPMLLRIVPENLNLDTYVAVRDDGLLEVQLCIMNNGTTPVDLNCFVRAQGRPQLNAIVNDLKPESKVFKQFIFQNGRALVGTELITGLKEIEGPRIINKTTPIH